MPSSLVILISISLLVAVVSLAWSVLYNCFLSPLRHIPGPLLARLTGKWLVFVDLAGDRTSTINRLHQRYGSAVCVGPNEVSFAAIDVVKEIYGQQTVYMKAPIYDTFSLKPLGIFSLRDRQAHSQRRRLLSHAFSQSNLNGCEPLLVDHLDKLFVNVFKRIGQPLDMFAMFRMLALDIVGELFLGKSFDALDSDQPPPFLDDVDKHFLISGIDGNFPWVYRFLCQLPIPFLQHFFSSRDRLAKYGLDAFKSYTNRYGRNSKRRDLLTKILNPESKDGTPPLTDLEIYIEIGNLVFAGTDTTSTTLTYLFWELTRNPLWQKRLQEELLSVPSHDSARVPSYKSIIDLPILDAVVNESLRMHPAAPASLQRVVPPGGRTISTFFVPEHTVVSMQCYTTQRDPAYFPDPEKFDPERWLSPSPVTNEMKEMFMPFSKGPRACLGKSLAMMELKLATATLMKNFDVSAAAHMTDDDMVMKDHFLVLPKAGKCDLVFSGVERS